jgi:hypothetical protein
MVVWFGPVGCEVEGSDPASGDGAATKADSVETDDGGETEGDVREVALDIHEFFAGLVAQRHPPGSVNVKRAVFLKDHGCATARFSVLDALPDALRVGLFAETGEHDAWVRISSDTVPQSSDFSDNTIGFAIKILDVPGQKILEGEEEATTHDFLLQNHHVFFVDTALDFLEFTESIFDGSLQQYLADHPTTDEILTAMAKPVQNVRGVEYFSTTPYRFGDGHAKYKVVPCDALEPELPPAGEPNYLRSRLIRDLTDSSACFELQVQLQQGEEMPLDAATVEWSEDASPHQTVARITIPTQDITENDATCENMSFTAWHALPEHRPVGSVNEARGIVYKLMADNRRERNGVPIGEVPRG